MPQASFDDLLRLDLSSESEDFAVDFRDTAVQWLNDIERDKQYAKWPASITELLRHTYPGMLRTVRKNMYYLVLYSMQFHQETTRKILSLTKADTHQLLKLHGYSGEYLIVMALAKAVVLNLNPPKTMEQILK